MKLLITIIAIFAFNFNSYCQDKFPALSDLTNFISARSVDDVEQVLRTHNYSFEKADSITINNSKHAEYLFVRNNDEVRAQQVIGIYKSENILEVGFKIRYMSYSDVGFYNLKEQIDTSKNIERISEKSINKCFIREYKENHLLGLKYTLWICDEGEKLKDYVVQMELNYSAN